MSKVLKLNELEPNKSYLLYQKGLAPVYVHCSLQDGEEGPELHMIGLTNEFDEKKLEETKGDPIRGIALYPDPESEDYDNMSFVEVPVMSHIINGVDTTNVVFVNFNPSTIH